MWSVLGRILGRFYRLVILCCPVVISERELCADLVMLDMTDYDVILGMDFLSKY